MIDEVEINTLEIETRARALRAAYVREMFAGFVGLFRAPAQSAQV